MDSATRRHELGLVLNRRNHRFSVFPIGLVPQDVSKQCIFDGVVPGIHPCVSGLIGCAEQTVG